MSAGWLVYALAVGALICVACHAAAGLCRERRMATRWIWAAGLAAVALLSARALLTSNGTGHAAHQVVEQPINTAAITAPAPEHGVVHALAAMYVAGGTALRLAAIAATRALPAWLGTGAMFVWLAASAAALIGIALVQLRLSRLRRGWPTASLQGHAVRIAPALGPAVLGVVQPFIVVPRWLFERSAAEQRLVLAHEDEHLRARDPLLLAAAWVLVALVAWHPAAWWMLSRLRLAMELDCDARVLRRGVEARTYGTLLIDLAGQCTGFTAGATALADERSHLERRLLAMKQTPLRHRHLRAGAYVAIGLLALAAACEARMPTSAEVQNMDVASAEKSAASAGMLKIGGDANTWYYVDGVKTDADIARAIEKSRIQTIEVSKVSGASEIRISTVGNGATAPAGQKVRVQSGNSHGHGERQGNKPFAGVLFIDGLRADSKTFNGLSPDQIVSIQIFKGPKAIEMSNDPAAANGIIKVTTKAAPDAK